MFYFLAATQIISFLMIIYLDKKMAETDKQIVSILTVLNKRFGITFSELAKTMKYYYENDISMED